MAACEALRGRRDAASREVNMYKHILLPVDGSCLSEDAARTGIAIARAVGARVTALHVVPRTSESPLESWAHSTPDFAMHLDDTLLTRGARLLEQVRHAARLAGVPCECQVERGAPHEAILESASRGGCDLIVMASHGRGDASETLDSETVKVMTLGYTPVLVHHARRDRERRLDATESMPRASPPAHSGAR
jgi:nucleotide-binding universal stress UspA family protein